MLKGFRALLCIMAAVVVASSASVSQILPGRMSASSPGQANLSLTTGADTTFRTNTDIIMANGAIGPYMATYKPVNRFSESVTVDGKLVQRDFEYTMDYSTGGVTFKKTVSANSVIRVEYSFNPTTASTNKAAMSIPVTLDLVKRQGSGLQFTGLYKQADPNAKTTTDMAVYGLTGEKKMGQGQLSSMLLFSPDLSSGNGQSTFSDRAAMKFGGSTKNDRFSLSTSYVHVGEQFSGAKDYGLQQGMDVMDLAAGFSASKNLNFSSSLNRTEALTGEKKGEVVASSLQKMVLTSTGGPKMTLTHGQVDKGKPNTSGVQTTTDSLLLEQKFNANTSVVASHENVTVDNANNQTDLTTNQLVLTTKPINNLGLTSKVVQKDSSTDGAQIAYGMDINSNPNKTTSLTASVNRLDADKTGMAATESMALIANPSKYLNIDMKLAHANTDAAGDELVHNLKIISTPRTNWRMELGMNGRNVSRPEDESARMFNLSTTSLRNTSVQLNWLDKESDIKGGEQVEGVRVVSNPYKFLKVSGGLSQRQTSVVQDISKDAAMELQPFANATLTGAYRETESNGTVVGTVSEVSAAMKPSTFLQVSGAYKTRGNVGQADVNSTNVAMQVGTGRLFNVTGSYNANPEDQKGVVQRFNAQTVGVKTDFGKLKMHGAYTMKDEYLAGKLGQQTEFGVDIRTSQNAVLTTSYSVDERRDTSVMQTHVYALGYTHNVGSRLNIYLTGRMTQYEKDRMLVEDQTEYEAEARLGLKF